MDPLVRDPSRLPLSHSYYDNALRVAVAIISNCYLGRTSLPPSCKKRLGATLRRSHISIKYPQKGKVLPITLLEIPSRLPNGGASTSLWRQTMAQKSYW